MSAIRANLAGRLVAMTLLVSVLGLLSIALIAMLTTAETLHQSQRNRLLDRVSASAKMLEGSIAVARRDIGMLTELCLSSMGPDHPGNPLDNLQPVADQLAAVMRKENGMAQGLVVLEEEGVLRFIRAMRLGENVHVLIDAPMPITSIAQVLKEKQGLRQLSTLDAFARWATSSVEASRQVLFLSQPIFSSKGVVLGVVVLIADIAALASNADYSHDEFAITVSDARGQLLTRSDATGAKRPGASNTRQWEELHRDDRWSAWIRQGDAVASLDLPLQSRLVALRKVTVTEHADDVDRGLLVVGGEISLATIDATVAELRLRLAIVLVVMGALMVGILIWGTRRIAQPIGLLTAAADHIASGEQRLVPLLSRGDDIGVLARSMQRMAEALRKAAKDEEAAVMGRMASTIAHDLRNALSSVKMNLRILHGYHSGTADEKTENCSIALEQIDYMEDVLADLLTYARPEGEALDWVDIEDAIHTAAISLLPKRNRKSITLVAAENPPLPKILGDRTQIIRLLQNLLDNAIEATPQGGQVALSASAITVHSRPGVEMRIGDSGSGLAPDVAARAFEPFFTTRTKGTGLGLAIVAQIVRRHQGEVELQNGPNGGCIAIVRLPAEPPA